MKKYEKPIIQDEKIILEDIIASSADANEIFENIWDYQSQ